MGMAGVAAAYLWVDLNRGGGGGHTDIDGMFQTYSNKCARLEVVCFTRLHSGFRGNKGIQTNESRAIQFGCVLGIQTRCSCIE